jgi:hypothetical protein
MASGLAGLRIVAKVNGVAISAKTSDLLVKKSCSSAGNPDSPELR